MRRTTVRSRLGSLAAGVALVAAVMAWSVARPARVTLLVEGASTSPDPTEAGEYRRQSWVVRNVGVDPIRLRTRFTSGRCGFSLWLGQEHRLAAGDSLIVWLTLPTPSRTSAPFAGYAEVATSDSATPRLRFRGSGLTAPLPRDRPATPPPFVVPTGRPTTDETRPDHLGPRFRR